MREIVFATRNPNKIKEVAAMLSDKVTLIGLDEIGCEEELPETTDTIPGNALQKANYVKKHFNYNCFAEDTGLEVEALNGEPGVHTAYYAGPERDAIANMAKVLSGLENKQNRKARFRTVIALILNDQRYTFEGIVNGKIAFSPQGDGGFGYDPIFIPEGYEQSFGELDKEVKNKISHRARAVEKLIHFFENN